MNAYLIHAAPNLYSSFMPSLADTNPPHNPLLSKADFLHAVEMLAGEVRTPAIDDMATVLLACPYATWKQRFGELRQIQEYQGVACQSPVEVWEQSCSDGTVHCIGYFVDDPHEGQCVVLTRVCLF